MQSVTVIKHRYVIQNILLCFISRLVVPPMHPFLLQAAEEAHDSVIPTIAFSAHAALDNVLSIIVLAYWDPRSEWWIKPAFGLRNQIAIVNDTTGLSLRARNFRCATRPIKTCVVLSERTSSKDKVLRWPVKSAPESEHSIIGITFSRLAATLSDSDAP